LVESKLGELHEHETVFLHRRRIGTVQLK